LGLTVDRMHSGPLGGDLQIGAHLVNGEIDCVIFLRDPMTPQPHEPDINALVRACDVHNIPVRDQCLERHLVLSQLHCAPRRRPATLIVLTERKWQKRSACRTGGPEVMELRRRRPAAEPGPGEARVRHQAIGLNFIDVYFRTGLYPQPLPGGLGRKAPAWSRRWARASPT
jgi:hypothetical protein